MTRPYFESTFVSSSSMGGSMMPVLLVSHGDLLRFMRKRSPRKRRWTRRGARRTGAAADQDCHQVYDLAGRLVDVGVDDGRVELLLGGQLDPRGLEAARLLLRVLGAAADRAGARARPRSGGSRKTSIASGNASRTCRAPCRSISSSTLRPSVSAASIGGRGVP